MPPKAAYGSAEETGQGRTALLRRGKRCVRGTLTADALRYPGSSALQECPSTWDSKWEGDLPKTSD